MGYGMQPFDYRALTYGSEVYCTGCLPVDVEADGVMPVFADSEWDHYPVCDTCFTVHTYVTLTPEGVEAEKFNDSFVAEYDPEEEQ